ncbi:hypothetical protein [Rothia sp. CCM 9419]|uniref:hypothetical protein n=1 Tax=Rothia sp. CCM 9419 TaxID=3402662 RepID=UPI003ADE7D8E
MKKTLKNKVIALGVASALALGGAPSAQAATFGNHLNGASTREVFQVRYDGAAWNYNGSGYRNAWFKYTRNGKVLMFRYAWTGKTTGSVWDNLFDWGSNQTTQFRWGHNR